MANAQFIIALVIILAVGFGIGALIWVRRHSKSPTNLRPQQISIAALLLLALLLAAASILWPMKARFNSQSSDSARTSLEATNAVKAIVHIRRFTAYSPNSPAVDYAATTPPGYALRATASPGGSVNSLSMPSGFDEHHVFWNFPSFKPIRPLSPEDFKAGQSAPAIPPPKFDSWEEREAQRKVLVGQLQELQDQGPIPVNLGHPRLIFSITNGSGDISQGFLQLVHAETNQPATTVSDLPIGHVWPQGSETNQLSPEEQVLLIEQQRIKYPPAAPAPVPPPTLPVPGVVRPQRSLPPRQSSLTPEEQIALIEIQRAKLKTAPGAISPPKEFSPTADGPQKNPPQPTTIDPQSGLPSPGLAAPPGRAAKVLLAQQPPVVVETFPQSGARDVAAGETEIRVRFSKPMQDDSWSWSTAWENSTPESIGSARYLNDGRTCVLKVRLEPGHTYAWWLNSTTFKNFQDTAGIPAVPYLLIFQTKPH